jgi:hypothetical protein
MMIFSCSFIVLCSLAALPAQDTIRGRSFGNPILARSGGPVQPYGVRRLNGRRVSKLRQGCSRPEEQRCSHLRATHGPRVDSLPVRVVPTHIPSGLQIDAPDFDR